MDASIYRLRYRDILTLCVIALLSLGVVMVQSASMRVTGQIRWQWTSAGLAQLKMAVVALITYFVIARIDYARLGKAGGNIRRNPTVWLAGVAAFLCLVVLVPGIGKQINGARRWLPLGFTQLQPSELGKWAVVLFLAWALAFRPLDLSRFTRGLLPL